MHTLNRDDSLRARNERVIPRPTRTARGNWPWNHYSAMLVYLDAGVVTATALAADTAYELFMFCQDVPRFRVLTIWGPHDAPWALEESAYYETSFLLQGDCSSSNLGDMNPDTVDDKQSTVLTTTTNGVVVPGYYVTGTVLDRGLHYEAEIIDSSLCFVELIGSSGILEGGIPWSTPPDNSNNYSSILREADYTQAMKDNDNILETAAGITQIVGLYAPPA